MALGLAGLRIGETLGMAADRTAVDRREVTVDQQAQPLTGRGMVLTTPKAERCRTIKVPGLVAVELRRHLRDHPEALAAAGLGPEAGEGDDDPPEGPGRFVFHALRHFCASTLLAEGAPIIAVAGHLGDQVQTVTSTYAHWLRDDRDVPAEVLDRVLAPAAVSPVCHDAAAEGV